MQDRVKKEIKDFAIGNQDDVDEYDDMGKLTSEGKQMRKLVRDLEKNRAYESDDDIDPYASSVRFSFFCIYYNRFLSLSLFFFVGRRA